MTVQPTVGTGTEKAATFKQLSMTSLLSHICFINKQYTIDPRPPDRLGGGAAHS